MKKIEHRIADGDAGIDETVEEMWRLIVRDVKDPIIKEKAKELSSESKIDSVKNIYNYVVDNFSYRPDPPGVEHFTAPVHLLTKKHTKYRDCDDLVGLLSALLLAEKVPVRLKVIAWRIPDYTHIVAEFYYEGDWIPLDPVRGRNGFGKTITEPTRESGLEQIRTKIYNNAMSRKFITLEDGCEPCGAGMRSGRGDNSNILNFILGNTSSNREMLKHFPQPTQKPEPIIKEVEKEKIVQQKVYIPVETIKRIKTPFRIIANQPITFYREYY